jgi:hypothetical protein
LTSSSLISSNALPATTSLAHIDRWGGSSDIPAAASARILHQHMLVWQAWKAVAALRQQCFGSAYHPQQHTGQHTRSCCAAPEILGLEQQAVRLFPLAVLCPR